MDVRQFLRFAHASDPTVRPTESFDIQRYLAFTPLFSEVSVADRARIAQGCSLRRLSKGEMVFRAGDPCDAFFIVIVGQAKLFMLAPNGQEKVIELCGPGHSFAEAMVFLNMPYVVNVQCLADSLLLAVGKDTVFQELEREPQFARRLLAGLSKRLHGLVQDVESYALRSGMQRLIGFLLRDTEQDNAQGVGQAVVELPVSKATVASRLSLTPEYFSRVLHELEAEGLIQIDKREIRILDIQRLAQYGSH